jgi:CubicO group peptidase (beta-lactamase class C family)
MGRRLILGTTLICVQLVAQTPSDAGIRKLLAERIDTLHQSVGIVVGVIMPQGRRIVSYGALNKGDSRPLDGDTVFEIGSVSKVFTSLLLSEMVAAGQVALDDPISKYLPAGTKVPQRTVAPLR